MNELYKNLHKLENVSKKEAMSILDVLFENCKEENKEDVRKVYKYFFELKSKGKNKDPKLFAHKFTTNKNGDSVKLVKGDKEGLWATDSYCLINVECEGVDGKYFYKGKEVENDLQFVNYKFIMDNFPDKDFVELDIKKCETYKNDGNLEVIKLKTISTDSNLDFKMFMKFYKECDDVVYSKFGNCDSPMYFKGTFKGLKVRYVQMPIVI